MEFKYFSMSRMPTLLFCLFSLSAVRAQVNDTLFFKSENIRIVTVRQHDEKTLTYECLNRKKEMVEKRIRLTRLKAFVIYDDAGNLVRDSRNSVRRES